MSSFTLAGTTLAIVASLPATNDSTGFAALVWVPGTCALRNVPGVMRDWAKVTENLVCATTNVDKKGSSKWAPATFTLSNLRGAADAAQAIYTTLEADRDGVGSFRLSLANGSIIYWTAQVSKFTLADGGGQDDYHTSSVELLIQTSPVYVAPV